MPFERMEDVNKGVVHFPPDYWSSVSSTVTSLIKGMLIIQPTKRFGVSDVLSHPWLKVVMPPPFLSIMQLMDLQNFTPILGLVICA